MEEGRRKEFKQLVGISWASAGCGCCMVACGAMAEYVLYVERHTIPRRIPGLFAGSHPPYISPPVYHLQHPRDKKPRLSNRRPRDPDSACVTLARKASGQTAVPASAGTPPQVSNGYAVSVAAIWRVVAPR